MKMTVAFLMISFGLLAHSQQQEPPVPVVCFVTEVCGQCDLHNDDEDNTRFWSQSCTKKTVCSNGDRYEKGGYLKACPVDEGDRN